MNYLIKKGKHRARFWPLRIRPHFGIRSRVWRVKFDPSCHYDWKAKPELDAWNKLVGWSNWNGKHSIRVGWRPYIQYQDNNENEPIIEIRKVWLGAYLKENGKRTTYPPEMSLGYWEYGEELEVTMALNLDRSVTFHIIGAKEEIMTFFSFGHNIGFGWLSSPYFGGRATAPHDMKIEIKK